ncbi:MAG: hypothetical protein R3B46_09150 [Phycisphaerales bacterium]|nr:hypothetical protein [Phycisphaerales bacterium]
MTTDAIGAATVSIIRNKLTRRVALCLLLGAIVNVAVAWTLAAIPMIDTNTMFHKAKPTSSWRITAQPGWPEATSSNTATARGVDLIMIDGGDQEVIWYKDCAFESEATAHKGSYSHHVNITEFGLPARSMRTWSLYLRSKRDQPQERFGYLSVEPLKKVGLFRDWSVLPLLPIPLGFTINTLFYATILFTSLFGFTVARRYSRARKGLCRACAYDLADLNICPECGLAGPAPTQ